VDDTSYTEWEAGYKRNTTNDEYRQKYRAIYEQRVPYETVFRLRPTDGQHPHITTLVPVKNTAGEVAAILCAQRPINELVDAVTPYLSLIFTSVLVMVVVGSLLVAGFLRKSIIKPVETVSEEAQRFAKEHSKGEPLGELSKYSVIQDLSSSIDSMETDMLDYVRRLTAITGERERLKAEMSIAAQIQTDNMPAEFPAFPDRDEFDIYATMEPARGIGGDFYNFFLTDDDHLAMIMADVSGKGVPGALFMMVTNIFLSIRTQMGGTPSEILQFVNERLCEHNKADMFVTVWLGVLEISSGHLVFANAGHEFAALYRKGGAFEILKDRHGFVLGGMEGVRFKDNELTLGRGDKLFLYTDGVPEATNGENQMYTIERMLEALNVSREESPHAILEGVKQSVDAFVGDAPQFDDLTMLCFEMKVNGN
jgi:sigma-B regulation protein RsbU (phosphoserine phosphatase)